MAEQKKGIAALRVDIKDLAAVENSDKDGQKTCEAALTFAINAIDSVRSGMSAPMQRAWAVVRTGMVVSSTEGIAGG